jgi:hypothetical protein
MKTLNQLMITIAVAAAAIPSAASAQVTTQPTRCESMSVQIQAVALPAPRSGSLVNFSGSGGQLDPVPLLESTFTVPPSTQRAVCVFLTFSAQIDPGDNYGVYQASIDDIPMVGHGSLAAEYPGFTTPVVFDAVNQGSYLPVDPYRYFNGSNSRFVSYTFFAMVSPGAHTMRVKVAACCSPVPGGMAGVFVRAATAVLKW